MVEVMSSSRRLSLVRNPSGSEEFKENGSDVFFIIGYQLAFFGNQFSAVIFASGTSRERMA